jgi:hypothetical protein
LFKTAVESWTTRPDTWTELVDWLEDQIQNNLPTGLPSQVQTWLQNQLRTQMQSLRTNPNGARLFDELERELMSSIYGGRDAQWALAAALGRARRSIRLPARARRGAPRRRPRPRAGDSERGVGPAGRRRTGLPRSALAPARRGLGAIERLSTGVPDDRPPSPAPVDVVNPEGLDYPLLATVTQLALVGASAY